MAGRGVETDFLELIPAAEIGPVGQADSTTTSPTVNAVIWSLVPSMTQDLKNAIVGFINQDKTGNSSPITTFDGRSKIMEFEFQGTPSNIYQFGEIGLIKINMSYPPGSNIAATTLTPQLTRI